MERNTEYDLAEVMAALKRFKDQGSVGAATADPHEDAVKRLPGKGEMIKSAPAVAMICGTTIFLAIMSVFVTLTIVGRPTDELFRLMNLFLNALGAIGVLFTLGVAIMHARRTMENRQIALGNARDAHKAADHASQAHDAAVSARSAVNGELEQRLARVLAPLVRQAAHDAAVEAVRLRCNQEGQERDNGPP